MVRAVFAAAYDLAVLVPLREGCFRVLLKARARLRVYFNTFNTFNYVYVPAEACWIRLCGMLSA